MKRKIRAWLRRWLPTVIGWFEPAGRKGKWFEEQYYTYLFTRNKHYSSPQPNEEESERWEHIEVLVREALVLRGNTSFSKIIDFGCGRGWLAKELSAYGAVTGIEPIGKVVEYGRKIYPGLDLLQGDVNDLEAFNADLIVCSEVIEHIGKGHQASLFESFFHSLKAGGYLILTTPRAEAYHEWSEHIDLDQPTEEWLTEEEVKTAGEHAGFTVIKKNVYGRAPKHGAPKVDIYQQWLFRKQGLWD
jgi:SAM-dependent methyltransferase